MKDGKFTCKDHGEVQPEFSMVVSGVLDDGTGNIRAVFFRDIAEKLFDMSAKELKDLQAVKTKIESLQLEVKARVGEEGKLFGSVTTANLHELLSAEGVEVDRRRIELKDPIKEAGEFTVPVKLHRDVVADLKVHVVPEA